MSDLREIRARALRHFVARGLPNRQQEAWRETNIEPFSDYSLATQGKIKRELVATLPMIRFVDGRAHQEDPGARTAQTSLFSELSAAEFSDLWDAPLPVSHGLTDLLLAYGEDGLILFVPPGQTHALELQHLTTSETGGRYLRHMIVLGEGAQLTLLERSMGCGRSFFEQLTEIELAKDARIQHIKLQQEGPLTQHLNQISVRQEAGSRYELRSFSFGAKRARTDVLVTLEGAGAATDLQGLSLGYARQHQEHVVHVEHAAPNTVSGQVFKSILRDQSRAVFTGRVKIEPGASGVVSHQLIPTLLLSESARAYTRPQLEIYNDDVVCTHGATVGAVDDAALFYMAQRGISPELARQLLLEAFATEVMVGLPKDIHTVVQAAFTEWLQLWR